MGTISALLAGLLVGTLVSCPAAQEFDQTTSPARPEPAPEVEAVNVLFRYSPELAVLIVRLRAKLVPTPGHSLATFNDPASFTIAIEAAEIRLSAAQLAALMNTRIAASPKAQVRNVRISASGDQLQIDGTMKRGIHIPFHAIAQVGITTDNRVRIQMRKVSAGPLPMKGLLDAMGITVSDLVSQKGLKGMSIEGDSFLIDPQTVFPPPQIQARLTAARVAKNGIALQFGAGTPRLTTGERGNYIALRGGRIGYGREEMIDSDLTMTDSTPADPFEFYLARYWRQMVAGQVKVTPDKALRIRVPDYAKIGATK